MPVYGYVMPRYPEGTIAVSNQLKLYMKAKESEVPLKLLKLHRAACF